MSDNFIGEIRLFSFPWAPQGWALCDGATLQIVQNQALYSLLGVQFGGDARTTFKLPDLRGRTPVYGVNYQGVANAGGQEQVALTADQMPPHGHAVFATTNTATSPNASGTVLATVGPDKSSPPKVWPIYSAAATTGLLASASVSTAGATQPHNNMQPFAVINFCIAVTGIYPSRQ